MNIFVIRTFSSYNKYIHYVNFLCPIFIIWKKNSYNEYFKKISAWLKFNLGCVSQNGFSIQNIENLINKRCSLIVITTLINKKLTWS